MVKISLNSIKLNNWRISVVGILTFFFLFSFISEPLAFEIGYSTHFQQLESKCVSVLLDPKREYTSENLPLTKFKTAKNETLNFGFYNGVVWLKFKAESPEVRSMILEIKNPMLDRAEIFVKKEGRYEKIGVLGDQFPFSKRKIKHRFHQIRVEVPNEFLVRIDNLGDQLFASINIMDNDGVEYRDSYGQLLWGIYFGFLYLILLFVLAVYILERQKSFLFYLGYVLSMIFLQIVFSGFGNQYIFGEYVWLVNKLPTFFGALSSYFLILFLQSFLKTKKNIPKMNGILHSSKYVIYFVFFLLLCPSPSLLQIAALVINAFVLIMGVFLMFLTGVLVRRRMLSAYFLLISFVIFVAGIAIYVIRSFGLISNNIFTEYSLQIGSAVESGFIALAIIWRYKEIEDSVSHLAEQYKLLKQKETQKLELEVNRRTLEIETQNAEIENINEQIISSINFAQKIQESIIPSEEDFLKCFNTGFVFYKPKDIVSGDFYWSSSVTRQSDDKIAFAIGDCTGHGVPGAMLSVVAMRIFNNLRFTNEVNSAGTSLDYIDNEFKVLFQGEDINRNFHEGMDLAMCVFNPSTLELEFSGAKNGMVLIRDNSIFVYKGNKKTIGWVLVKEKYTQTKIQLEKGDRLYFTTDGYTDQFGGEKNKKLKFNQYLELIMRIQHIPLIDQKKEFILFFNQWKGNEFQTDDVCVVGIEI